MEKAFGMIPDIRNSSVTYTPGKSLSIDNLV